MPDERARLQALPESARTSALTREETLERLQSLARAQLSTLHRRQEAKRSRAEDGKGEAARPSATGGEPGESREEGDSSVWIG